MQKKEVKQMESLLLNRKNTLLRAVEKRLKKYRDTNTDKVTDIVEIASSSLHGELEIAVAEEGARELKQIEDALARIRAGHYGVCEQCGQMIKKARLKAIPFATLCISCKEEEERVCNEKTTLGRYGTEEVFGNSENNEACEIGKKELKKKIIEFEYDDNRN
ncbi:MAG: TraR/DksA family transcriptional regulator [Candidatus Brocadia sp.]|nr:TraR/DksA family transcriptional regulator [Candidatus Brocadia sp.]NUO08251.1 TraR/DksA family transcriptional regulator [Candidatus Brocadia sp.]